jgi:hypothetical protein
MLTKFLKPTRGVVLMPERGYRELPVGGANVPVNSYYQSLLRFGDVVEVSRPAPAEVSRPAPVAKKAAVRPAPADAQGDS